MTHDIGNETNPYLDAFVRLRRAFVGAAILSALVNLLMLTGPLFMLQVYDRVLASGSVATLQGLLIIVVAAYLFLGIYDFLRARIMSRAAYRLDAAIGPKAFDIWVKAGISGEAAPQRPLNDLATVRAFLSSPAMLGIFDLPWMPFYLAIVWIIHPWLGMLALFGAVVVTILALANQFLTHRHFAKAMTMDGREAMFVEQAHRNGETLVPLGMLGKVGNYWQTMHAAGLKTGQTGSERAEGFAASTKAFRLLLQSCLLGLGGYLALQQEISPGMIVAASIIAGRALAPVDQVIGQWRNVVRSREAHKRLKATMAGIGSGAAPIALPEPKGALTVRSLTKFVPGPANRRGQAPILDDIGFSLDPGDGLGVIGPSASGKTSLARLLMGAWTANAGDVRLDGATLDQWSSDDLGRYLGYLPQNVELLPGSIRDNIARFDPQAEDETVIAAAQMAGVHEMLLGLPDGYGTMVGQGGSNLSGGQTQRIGLARAVYGSPKLVVLDEPNSNLDSEGDEALGRAIVALREQGSTVVVMAHRPSAIAAVNKLMVLNAGRIVDLGEKAEVLRRATRAAPPSPPQSGANDKVEFDETA
ncbi:type I secretion system permease/ATPase [Ahrensia sp. R2A130]|uniref:type I secretion system permease/ATPase n=1 Tax=Ahrensia sp. R2A130 TaxID=744979 RepID=UPI0001E09CAD|nr:type I secretion system permease/ATPase [Ahrensia sp. R2A130]EFL88197.1 alkaline protease secretion ATP-binding protein AprD [Ahrensia sp. R2A130]